MTALTFKVLDHSFLKHLCKDSFLQKIFLRRIYIIILIRFDQK